MPIRSEYQLGPKDPDERLIECEICGQQMKIGQSHSIVVSYATTGPDNLPAFACDALQHFACSSEHAAEAAKACIDEHLLVLHQQRTAAQKAALGQ